MCMQPLFLYSFTVMCDLCRDQRIRGTSCSLMSANHHNIKSLNNIEGVCFSIFPVTYLLPHGRMFILKMIKISNNELTVCRIPVKSFLSAIKNAFQKPPRPSVHEKLV